jgi:hypothetical protein
MSAGPAFDEDDLKRSPTAQQFLAVKQLTATREVIGAPGTEGVLADQVRLGIARGEPEAAKEMTRPPTNTPATTPVSMRKRDMHACCQTARLHRGLSHEGEVDSESSSFQP